MRRLIVFGFIVGIAVAFFVGNWVGNDSTSEPSYMTAPSPDERLFLAESTLDTVNDNIIVAQQAFEDADRDALDPKSLCYDVLTFNTAVSRVRVLVLQLSLYEGEGRVTKAKLAELNRKVRNMSQNRLNLTRATANVCAREP